MVSASDAAFMPIPQYVRERPGIAILGAHACRVDCGLVP